MSRASWYPLSWSLARNLYEGFAPRLQGVVFKAAAKALRAGETDPFHPARLIIGHRAFKTITVRADDIRRLPSSFMVFARLKLI